MSEVIQKHEFVDIYGLYEPDGGALRYVGKAKDANKRLKKHLEDRNKKLPLYGWIRKLLNDGKVPNMVVLERVPADQWEEAERRLIAQYRKTCDLLNLADGGAMPKPTIEQRKNAARAAYKAITRTPEMKRLHNSRMDIGRMHKKFLNAGDFKYAAKMRFMMRIWAADRPDIYGCWANL